MIKNIVLFGTLIILLCALGYSHYSREIYYQTYIADMAVRLYQANIYARTFEDKSKRLTKQIAIMKKEIEVRDELIKQLGHKLSKDKKLLIFEEDLI